MRTIEELSPCELEEIALLKRLHRDIVDVNTIITMTPKSGRFLGDAITKDDMNRIKEFIRGVIGDRIKEVAK